MNEQDLSLLSSADFGWTSHCQAAATEQGLTDALMVRVLAVHRDAFEVAGPGHTGRLPGHLCGSLADGPPTVGDWLALDPAGCRPRAILARASLFKRRQPGAGARLQPIAANIDTVLLVTSANQDFNVARLERYLAVAHEARVTPVVVLSKADLASDLSMFRAQIEAIDRDLACVAVDARGPGLAGQLAPWLRKGETLALLGSSGVGKSTIVNGLLGEAAQATAAIREADARGRHTTTGRSLHLLASGAWLIDTPGMRELQIVDVAEGLEAVFDDIVALAGSCRFADCRHDSEPGCAVQAALADGTLEPARLARYRKLEREDRRNSEAAHEAHARFRRFGRMVRRATAEKRRQREHE